MRFFIIFFLCMFVFTSEKMTPTSTSICKTVLTATYPTTTCSHVNMLCFFFVLSLPLSLFFWSVCFMVFFVCFTSKCCITYSFFFFSIFVLSGRFFFTNFSCLFFTADFLSVLLFTRRWWQLPNGKELKRRNPKFSRVG